MVEWAKQDGHWNLGDRRTGVGSRGVLVIAAMLVFSGCAQGRGDWPTLASAIGWGEVPGQQVSVPPPPTAPVRVAAVRGAPALTEWARPPAIPSGPRLAYGASTAPVAVSPPPPPVSYPPGDDVVAQAFAQGFAATAPTIMTVTSSPTFAAPNAHTLPTDLSGIVPKVVLDTYNDALTNSSTARAAGNATASVPEASGATSQVEYLDPTVIHFRSGSARLSPRDKRRIARLVKKFRSQGGMISVIGHASSRTGDMNKQKHNLTNFDISFDRANAVTDELIRQGVDPGNLAMEARADRDPIYYEYMPAGEAGNQRVEIFLE